MDALLQLALTALVVFSGIPMGIYILFVAPEESAPGKKWFQLVMSILLSLSVFFSFKNIFASIGLSCVALFVTLYGPAFFSKHKLYVLLQVLLAAIAGILVGFAQSIIVPVFVMLFFVAFASYNLAFKNKDINIKLGRVKHKGKYLWTGIWPHLTFFLGVALTLLF
jgi:hypothetical protein